MGILDGGSGLGTSVCWEPTGTVAGGLIVVIRGTMGAVEVYSEADSAGCWDRRAYMVSKEWSTSGHRNLSPSVRLSNGRSGACTGNAKDSS